MVHGVYKTVSIAYLGMSQETALLIETEIGIEIVRGLATDGRLAAILDACDSPAVLEKVEEVGPDRAISLYRGTAEERYAAIAPYLVMVDAPLLDWIVATIWQEPWGFFAVSGATRDELRRHFRRFLKVVSPGGEQWFFRFYDPRVLSVFLPTCNAGEIVDLFGPVTSFVLPGDARLTLKAIEPIRRQRSAKEAHNGAMKAPETDPTKPPDEDSDPPSRQIRVRV